MSFHWMQAGTRPGSSNSRARRPSTESFTEYMLAARIARLAPQFLVVRPIVARFSTDGHKHHHEHRKPDESRISFIEKVKVHGANAMLGFFTGSERFDRVLEGLNVTRVGSGNVTCELTVGSNLQNSYSTLHGGEACVLDCLCFVDFPNDTLQLYIAEQITVFWWLTSYFTC